MRGMLIDNDDAIAGLGEDVVVMKLRPRGTERRIDMFWRGRLRMGARVGS